MAYEEGAGGVFGEASCPEIAEVWNMHKVLCSTGALLKYGGGYMDWKNLGSLPIGKGKIDFARFFDFVSSTGYDGDFTVEATAHDIEGNVDIEMLNGQFKCIREYLLRFFTLRSKGGKLDGQGTVE